MAELSGEHRGGSESNDTTAALGDEQEGYRSSLKPRQVQMIAMGGAIGTGLFMAAGGRLASAGPSLVLVYAVCGVFAYFILRALGELVMHRPSSGSIISYAREFLGEKAAFVSGWLYVGNWATTAIADVTAAALYVQYWSAFSSVPQWLLALIALVLVLTTNLLSVKVFGEMEFWFALIKVTALIGFLLIGTVFLVGQFPIDADDGTSFTPGLTLWADHGGMFPSGLIATVLVIEGVVFAYAGIELIGTAAGETQHSEKVIPKAINSVILRIGLFYVGSILLLSLLLPYTSYSADESPFVTFFSSLGSDEVGLVAGSVMNFVVLTAALSSLNAGLYSTGRVLRSMASTASAPAFTYRLNKQGVPFGGILLTAAVVLLGILLNLIVPESAFEIVLNLAAIGIIAGWGTIVLAQLRLQAWARAGRLPRPAFRMPGAPVTSWITLVFLAAVIVLMLIDYPIGTFTVASFALVGIPALVIGWFAARGRIRARMVEIESGRAIELPVVAETPAMEALVEYDVERESPAELAEAISEATAEESAEAAAEREADR